MRTVFQFREGSHLRGDAQLVGERLEAIRAKCKSLTPYLVVKDASNIRSPLHQYFEWDDAKAATAHRLQQAGHLIRCVSIVFEDAEKSVPRQIGLDGSTDNADASKPVRAFVSIKGIDGDSSYVSTMQAMSDPELRRQVLEQAHNELSAVGRKYRDLTELSQVFMALDSVGQILSDNRQTT